MTEIKEETPVEAKVFGTADARRQVAAYQEAVNEAGVDRRAAYRASEDPLDAARKAVRELLPNRGNTRNAAAGVGELLAALSLQSRTAQREAAEQAYTEAIEVARETRDAVLGADPFTRFVSTYIANNFGDSYADTLYDAMPVSYAGLKHLANGEDWCGDFEKVMLRAVREGALPDDKVQVTRSVEYRQVTGEHNAQHGEAWTVTFEVNPFVRIVDSQGCDRSFYALSWYASNVSFQRVDKPEEKDAAQS